MSVQSHEPCGRREAIRAAARYLAAGGLLALSGRLAFRGRGNAGDGTCRRAAACRACGALAGCRLPRAIAEKRSRN